MQAARLTPALVTADEALAARLDAIQAALVAAADQRQSTATLLDVPTVDWLRHTGALSRSDARRLVRHAHRLADRPPIWQALADGRVSPRQADTMVDALRHLPDTLTPDQDAAAVDSLLTHTELDPAELRVLGNHLVDVIAPDHADTLLRQALERDEARARGARGLWLLSDGHTTMRIKGQFPLADGEHLAALIDAVAERHRRATDPGLPTPDDAVDRVSQLAAEDEPPAPLARCRARLDALLEIAQAFRDAGDAPSIGADRPRLVVTVPLHVLQTGLGALATANGRYTATELRQLACDADLVPAVLDTRGVPLDLGETHRLFPRACASPSPSATAAARSPAATSHHACAKPTTSSPGGANASPPSTTGSCSAVTTMPWSNPAPTAPTPTAGGCAWAPTASQSSCRPSCSTPTNDLAATSATASPRPRPTIRAMTIPDDAGHSAPMRLSWRPCPASPSPASSSTTRTRPSPSTPTSSASWSMTTCPWANIGG